MYCPKCGSPTDQDHSYCSHCGCSLDEWGVTGEHHQEHPHDPKRRSKPYWFYLIVFLALIMMVWGGYSLFSGAGNLTAIAKSQLQEIKTNKLTKAYYEHTSSGFRKENTLEEFKVFVEQNPSLKDYLNIDIVKSEKDKKYGVVFLNLILPNNLVTKVKFEFVEEEGDWRILGISMEEPSPSDEEKEAAESTIVDAVKAHLEALRKGEVDKAYSMGSKDFLEATKLQGFESFVKEYPALSSDKAASMSIVEQEGNKALVRVLLYANGEPFPVDYIMISEDGTWKVWSFYVLTPSDDEPVVEEEAISEDVSDPIRSFLKNLQNGEIEKGYDQTAKQFQQTTSLDQFEEFLKQFPVIKAGQGESLKSKVSGNIGQARFLMKSNDLEAVVDYILTKEDGSWKILGIQLVDDTATTSKSKEPLQNEDFDSTFLRKAISGQLDQIKEKDLYSAYEDFTSEKFRSATPFENFARFVEQNTVFYNNSNAEFGELKFDNNIASIIVELTAEDGSEEKVEYDLVKEGENWKILSIKILNTNISQNDSKQQSTKDNESLIEEIDVGTEVNLSGQITNPSTKIKSTSSEIFATLFVKNVQSGTVIEVFFEHLDTGSSLPPVTKTLNDTGNLPISLVFSPPKGGWPVGKYLLKAKASTGEEKELEFEVID